MSHSDFMDGRNSDSARVAVLMATFDGAEFLEQQIDSIAAQTVDSIDLIVSDDGSTDGTRSILKTLGSGWVKGRFEAIDGPRRGFNENFRALIVSADIDVDFMAFSDQDDVWEPDKLERAISWLSGFRPDGAGTLLRCDAVDRFVW